MDIDYVFDMINKADENDRIEIYVSSKPTVIYKTKDEFEVNRLSGLLIVYSNNGKETTIIKNEYIRFIKILQSGHDDL